MAQQVYTNLFEGYITKFIVADHQAIHQYFS